MSFTYRRIESITPKFRLNDLDVFFSNEECLPIIEKVLNEDGKIVNFPGIEEDERWEKKMNIGLSKDVRFEAKFQRLSNEEYLMIWLIQPSGWEWADDDGFGFSGDASISLYSIIDKDGNFTKKFELYSIDSTKYY